MMRTAQDFLKMLTCWLRKAQDFLKMVKMLIHFARTRVRILPLRWPVWWSRDHSAAAYIELR
jgi:hypothetical protein